MTTAASSLAAAPKLTQGSIMRHVVVMTATGSIGLMAIFIVDFLNLFYISLLGEQERCAALGVPRRDHRPATEVVDDGEDVVGEARPREADAVGHDAVAVAAQVGGHASPVAQVRGARPPDPAVEAGGVGQQQQRTVAAELVQRDRDPVGGRHRRPRTGVGGGSEVGGSDGGPAQRVVVG